ncbi:helix-turn-helix domain-containing protein [Actinoallomurus rhizosphaericola]|uniref:helix-turn-helix domain-containing protein n=1 Tax=Actinoallomurus rhizosphaericola TaxID=2952536 RepID=UPI0021129C26|nr:helix-turn-helix domain-containing protein [Actinoallomurus rhizosphaericola]
MSNTHDRSQDDHRGEALRPVSGRRPADARGPLGTPSEHRQAAGGGRHSTASADARPGVPEPVTPSSDVRDEPLVYTPEGAARLLGVKPSWLRRKAAARAIPCTFLGKHLRFSRADLEAIVAAGRQAPRSRRR